MISNNTNPPESKKLLLPDVGVLALVPDQWNLLWQPRHHVMVRLARYFNVVWVNPPSETVFSEIENPSREMETEKNRPAYTDGLNIYTSGRFLPKFYSPKWLDEITTRLRLRNARGLLSSRGCNRIILYIWRPEFDYAMRMVRHDLSCYHIDDEYSFSDIEHPIDREELELIRSVGQVIIHSPGLMEKKGRYNPNTEFIPNGVDYAAYSRPGPVPADLAAIPKPWIGYTGFIKKQLDWEMLFDLIRYHPEWSFVFVGAIHAHNAHSEVKEWIQRLQGNKNIYFLGKKTVTELEAYPQHFDVCIMPYKRTAYTDYIYPMKLHEYLAGGRPVVASPIRSLENFGEVLKFAETADEWSQALTDSLKTDESSEDRVQGRQRIAAQFDWDKLVYRIAEKFCERLGPEYSERLKRISSSFMSDHNA